MFSDQMIRTTCITRIELISYQRKMIHTTQEDSMPITAPLLPTPTDSGRKQQLQQHQQKMQGENN